jgi:hypothetical protein
VVQTRVGQMLTDPRGTGATAQGPSVCLRLIRDPHSSKLDYILGADARLLFLR